VVFRSLFDLTLTSLEQRIVSMQFLRKEDMVCSLFNPARFSKMQEALGLLKTMDESCARELAYLVLLSNNDICENE